jgi:hypothetical protein
MKITAIKTIKGGHMFWLDIKRLLKIDVDGVIKNIEVRYIVNNHISDLEEPYIDYKKDGISKQMADAILYYLELGGRLSVSDILKKVGLKIDNFIVGGVDMNKECYPSIGITPALNLDVVKDKFLLSRIWFEKRIEFVYNRQIEVNMTADYYFDCITGVNSISTCWDKVHSISLMRTRNVNGVDIEHIIEDKSVIVDNSFVFQNKAIETFLLGYFFGCRWDDNVFFDEAHQKNTDFQSIYEEFCEEFNIGKL